MLETQALDNQQWEGVDDIERAKKLIVKVYAGLTARIERPERAFSIFDMKNEGTIAVVDF